jgi:hypothetical protein
MTTALCFSFVQTAVWTAEDQKTGNSYFVDLDGDGFNDNAPDKNNDGIPDMAGPEYLNDGRADFEAEEGIIDFGACLPLSDELLANSTRFNRRRFGARDLLQNRCGYDCDEAFGSGSGIGIGSVRRSGGCEGGVCGP